MFEGFARRRIIVDDVEIALVAAGDGPPLLLLHGYPQNHVMWHKIAPSLARQFTVVATDLRGYGESSKPESDAEHAAYSKRAMAADQVAVMTALGFEKFMVAGHDRGGRVAHRMALDHPDRVQKLSVLDIVPTYQIFTDIEQKLATAYYHWFFLIQPEPFPETMIANSLEFYLRTIMGRLTRSENAITEDAFAHYLKCLRDPATIHATCEDYRAAATIDLRHDGASRDQKITCPLLALWGRRAVMEAMYDVLAVWREWAIDVSGQSVDCGHFLPEEAPDETADALVDFFGSP